MTEPLKLAVSVARKLGMIQSWPNLQTIRLAIEGEADFSGVSIAEAAEMMLRAAREYTRPNSGERIIAEWEWRNAFQLNVIDRFWFEDARWRGKGVYLEFRAQLRERAAGEMTA